MGVTDTVPVSYLLDGRRPLLPASSIVPRVSFSSFFSVVSRFSLAESTFSKFTWSLANLYPAISKQFQFTETIFTVNGSWPVDRSRNADDPRSPNASTQRSDIVLGVPAKIKNGKIPKLGNFVRLCGATPRKNRCLYVRTNRERVFDERFVR